MTNSRIIKLDLSMFKVSVSVSVFGDLLIVCERTLKEMHEAKA
jgi:hypothetical protein